LSLSITSTLSFSLESAVLHYLKRKEKYKKRRRKSYTTLWRENPSNCSPLLEFWQSNAVFIGMGS